MVKFGIADSPYIVLIGAKLFGEADLAKQKSNHRAN
jgi:hypothetical protein